MRTNKKYLPSTTRRTKQLENVIKQFDNWRASRKKRGRIPEHLWDAAVSLCNDNSTRNCSARGSTGKRETAGLKT
jgi:hypothetical protein